MRLHSDLPAAVSPLRRARAWFAAALLTLASLALLPLPARAQFGEYEVKAAFLANFTQFVKWPAAAFSETGAPFANGILGNDPFGGALEKIVKGQTVAGRKIVIRRGRRAEELRNCQVVFIAKSERANGSAIVASLAGTHVLTVGEHDGFVKQGGAIGFTSGGGKVGFEINNGAARSAGLEISSRLLKLAGRVLGP